MSLHVFGIHCVSLDDVQLNLLERLPFSDRVTGVAQRANEIYIVVGFLSDSIKVYDSQTFSFSEEIPVRGSKPVHIQDITTNDAVPFIYVSDSNNECVWSVNADGNKFERKFHLPAGSCISLAPHGSLLALDGECKSISIFNETSANLLNMDLVYSTIWKVFCMQYRSITNSFNLQALLLAMVSTMVLIIESLSCRVSQVS